MHPLNPDAGAVPVTGDAAELAVAVRAGDIIWRAFPYIRLRYGKRGRRFGHSDVAWLFTLIERTEKERAEQVLWLADVLTWRGMPSIVLERQLELLASISNRRLGPGYQGPFRAMAAVLAERRKSVLSDAAFGEATAGFAERLGNRRSLFLKSYGALLVSAVIDKRLGASGAVEALTDWLLDPARHAPAADDRWQTAVSESLARIEAAGKTAPGGRRSRAAAGF